MEKIKTTVAILLLLVVAVMADNISRKKDQIPKNVSRVVNDTVDVVGTGAYWTDIFWMTPGAEKTLLVHANDTSSAGIASDSAVVDIEMYQVFLDWADQREVRLVKSKANPDSTSWPFSSDFVFANDLDVTAMDTACVYHRVAYPIVNTTGDTSGYTYALAIDSLYTEAAAAKEGFVYYPIVPDASDGIIFKVTGQAANRAAAGGSRWVFEFHQVIGAPVKVNE